MKNLEAKIENGIMGTAETSGTITTISQNPQTYYCKECNCRQDGSPILRVYNKHFEAYCNFCGQIVQLP